MFWHRPTSELVENWQMELENRLELGQSAFLPLGTSDTALFGALGVLALVGFENRRTDVVTPTVLIGGNHALWAATLLWSYQQPSTQLSSEQTLSPESPRLHIVYGGADSATYMFSQDLWVSAQRQRWPHVRHQPNRYFADLPPSLLHVFIPVAQPSATLNWETLPFLIKERQTPSGQQARWASSDSWMAWSVIVLVFILLLTALVV